MRVLYTTKAITFTILPPSVETLSQPTVSAPFFVLPPGSTTFPCSFSHQLFPAEIIYLKDLPFGYGTAKKEDLSGGEIVQRHPLDGRVGGSVLPSNTHNLTNTASKAPHAPKEREEGELIAPPPARIKGWEIHIVLSATDWGVLGKCGLWAVLFRYPRLPFVIVQDRPPLHCLPRRLRPLAIPPSLSRKRSSSSLPL